MFYFIHFFYTFYTRFYTLLQQIKNQDFATFIALNLVVQFTFRKKKKLYFEVVTNFAMIHILLGIILYITHMALS